MGTHGCFGIKNYVVCKTNNKMWQEGGQEVGGRCQGHGFIALEEHRESSTSYIGPVLSLCAVVIMSSTTCVKFISEMPTPTCGRKLGVLRRADYYSGTRLYFTYIHGRTLHSSGSLPVYY